MAMHISQKPKTQRLMIRCGYCDGRGKNPWRVDQNARVLKWHSNSCSVCKGKGKLAIELEGKLVRDGRCNGTGRIFDWSSDPSDNVTRCSACQGTGAQALTGSLKIVR